MAEMPLPSKLVQGNNIFINLTERCKQQLLPQAIMLLVYILLICLCGNNMVSML